MAASWGEHSLGEGAVEAAPSGCRAGWWTAPTVDKKKEAQPLKWGASWCYRLALSLQCPWLTDTNAARAQLQYHKAGQRRVDLELRDNKVTTATVLAFVSSASTYTLTFYMLLNFLSHQNNSMFPPDRTVILCANKILILASEWGDTQFQCHCACHWLHEWLLKFITNSVS